MIRTFLVIFCILFFISCRPTTYTPKPRGYAKVELPQHEYRMFNEPGFPYSFMYPTYARIIKDTLFFGQKPENPYWINIDFHSIGGMIYISYKPINGNESFGKLLEDSHEMSFSAHSKRADFIAEKPFDNGHGVYGLLFNVGGNAASAFQFIVSDSVKHFVRGALYFDVSPNADSLKPANDFLKEDMQYMLNSWRWKE
jgi:gliding motility-associated lipoprotein GldD